MLTVNNKLIVRPYKDAIGLKTEVKKGVSFVRQKINLVGVELVVDAKINNIDVKAGSKVYLLEENFATGQYTVERQSPDIEGAFVIIDSSHVIAVDHKNE
jgi:hypothetical protein